ncbi:MAG: hypothetical protein PVJ49_21400 [Acidobacteriota bacterium]|jgi:hypothetical protein
MRALPLALIAIGCGAAAACGPVYKTNYELTPPQTAEGRMCVTQCQQTKGACQSAGYDRYARCKSEQRAYAERKFNEYRIQQLLLGQPIKKSQRSFYGGYSCSHEQSYKSGCEQDFVGCFSTCGGTVTPHTVCVRNCEPPPAQPGHQLSGGPDAPLPR